MMGDSDRLFRVNASCNVGGADVCDEVTIEFAYFVVYINGADSFFPPFPLMDNAETAPMLVDGVGKQRCVNATAAAGEEFGLVKVRSRRLARESRPYQHARGFTCGSSFKPPPPFFLSSFSPFLVSITSGQRR